jgi:hypothetical protein
MDSRLPLTPETFSEALNKLVNLAIQDGVPRGIIFGATMSTALDLHDNLREFAKRQAQTGIQIPRRGGLSG